jgi:hypothetical protein
MTPPWCAAVCLCVFADVLAAALVPEGYSCFFRAKQPSPALKFGFPADGIALFYRHSRFSCNPAPEGGGHAQCIRPCHVSTVECWQQAYITANTATDLHQAPAERSYSLPHSGRFRAYVCALTCHMYDMCFIECLVLLLKRAAVGVLRAQVTALRVWMGSQHRRAL